MELGVFATGGIIFAMLFILMATGIPIAFALAITGLISLTFFAGGMQLLISSVMYNTVSNFTLTAVPLFVLAGEIILKSGISDRLYRGVSQWTSVIPGGLTQSNIVACAIFAAVSGSSVATAATIGTVALPIQKAQGYNRRLIMGSLAAGGTLGILIPPSIAMIVYGAYQNVSIPRLFIAGVIPGILLTILFIACIIAIAFIRPQWSPPREKLSWSYVPKSLIALKDVWPILVFIVVIMGGIYSGVMTPTEAAAVSCLVALVMCAAYRKLNLRVIWESGVAALRTSCFVFLIMIGAQTMGFALSMIKFPAALMQVALGSGMAPLLIWAGVCIIYLILGCIMDGFSLMLVTLPVVFPLLIDGLGFDPIWFGVQLVILVEAAMITPPVGVNVYTIHGIAGGDIKDVFIGILPFLVSMLIGVVIITALPWLATWLPGTMMGG